MTSSTERRPLLPTNTPSLLYRGGYAALGVGSLATAGLVIYGLATSYCSTTPLGLATQIFATVGCLCTTCLSGKEVFKPRQIQPIILPMTVETTKTDRVFQHLQALTAHFDTVLENFSKPNPNVVTIFLEDLTTIDGLVAKLDRQIKEVEAKVKNPNKDFVMSLVRKLNPTLSTHTSTNNSKQTTPNKLSTPSRRTPDFDYDQIVSRLEEVLNAEDPVTPTSSPPPSPTRLDEEEKHTKNQ
jgi:hypothetical protein